MCAFHVGGAFVTLNGLQVQPQPQMNTSEGSDRDEEILRRCHAGTGVQGQVRPE